MTQDRKQRDGAAEMRFVEPFAQSIATTFKSLSDPHRLLIAVFLARQGASLSELHRSLSISAEDLANEIGFLMSTGLACETISDDRPVYAIRCDKNRRFIRILGELFDLP